MSITSNAKIIAQAIENRSPNIQKALVDGLRQGMTIVRDTIIREQMTGRPGLKVQTGTLRRSWHVRKRAGQAKDGVTVRLSTSVKYARVHQEGTTIRAINAKALQFQLPNGQWVTKKSVTIPKRLHVYEYFKDKGLNIIRKRVLTKVIKALKLRGDL